PLARRGPAAASRQRPLLGGVGELRAEKALLQLAPVAVLGEQDLADERLPRLGRQLAGQVLSDSHADNLLVVGVIGVDVLDWRAVFPRERVTVAALVVRAGLEEDQRSLSDHRVSRFPRERVRPEQSSAGR